MYSWALNIKRQLKANFDDFFVDAQSQSSSNLVTGFLKKVKDAKSEYLVFKTCTLAFNSLVYLVISISFFYQIIETYLLVWVEQTSEPGRFLIKQITQGQRPSSESIEPEQR